MSDVGVEVCICVNIKQAVVEKRKCARQHPSSDELRLKIHFVLSQTEVQRFVTDRVSAVHLQFVLN